MNSRNELPLYPKPFSPVTSPCTMKGKECAGQGRSKLSLLPALYSQAQLPTYHEVGGGFGCLHSMKYISVEVERLVQITQCRTQTKPI